jgi:hypothetical protein
MPSSILLALLVGIAVLALVPALVRQYDAVELALLDLAVPTGRVVVRGAVAPGFVPERVRPPGQVMRGAVKGAASGVASRLEPSSMHQRRRRVLIGLGLLVIGQVVGVVTAGPAAWLGLAPSALVLAWYVLRLRAMVLVARRRAERRRRVELRRHRRAARLARSAALAAGVGRDVESLVAEWLGTAPWQRTAPSRQVSAALAAAGREVVRRSDGTWYPRPAPKPRPLEEPMAPAAVAVAGEATQRQAAARRVPVAPAAGLPSGGFDDMPLKKVVNG